MSTNALDGIRIVDLSMGWAEFVLSECQGSFEERPRAVEQAHLPIHGTHSRQEASLQHGLIGQLRGDSQVRLGGD